MVEPLEELYDDFDDEDGRDLRYGKKHGKRYGRKRSHRYCKYKKHDGYYYRKLTVNETEVEFQDEDSPEVSNV